MPPRERGRYQGMTAVVMAIGTIGGPLLGGVISDSLSWRWAFYINIPLGLPAFAWCAALLHLPATRRNVTIDYAGIASLAVAIGAVVLAATWAGVHYAWLSAPILGLTALAAAALAVFVAAGRRAADPVIPLHMFRRGNFILASVLSLVTGVVFGARFTRALNGRTPATGPAYLDAVAHGTGRIFLAVAVTTAAWFALSWLINEVPLRSRPPKPAPAPSEPR
ncbi:MFS transporter [Nonomuraea sp. K274]|uniref:MFS transporter n=1 Tax=Nonomuraea cypriaca TaxID=1187855 RepID=A0A931A4Z6_9ACTN|nr:MFS transporter [Nonomuraea cypriaca]